MSVERVASGIPGFDEITRGGFPKGRVVVVIGGAGSGKTILALQSLASAAHAGGEKGLFVAFEESSEQLMVNAAAFSWGRARTIEFVDARLTDAVVSGGDFDLLGLLAVVGAKCKKSKIRRIALDGLDVLLDQLGDPALIRREVFRLREWLHARGLTAIVTAKAGGPTGSAAQNYEFLEFMGDCVVVLRHRLVSDTALRTLQVSKLRGAAHSANAFPFSMTSNGIEVASVALDEISYPASRERVSTGVDRLDAMLHGGYHRGSSILITGAPGTAKTSLSASFAAASCRRRERTLYVSFDEGPEQIERNVSSIGVDFATPIRRGLLSVHSLRARSSSPQAQVAYIRRLIADHEPRAVVVDPISALTHVGDAGLVEQAAAQVLESARSSGVTLVSTSLLGSAAAFEETPIGISTVADTWIHLTYVNQGGERNRALTVVKSRGTGHSNQVRELILSDEGITLSDVYSAGGSVLMGTLRWEKETADRQKQAKELLDQEHREREAKLGVDEIRARMTVLTTELALHEAALERLRAARLASADQADAERRERLVRRRADSPSRRSTRARPTP